MPDNSTSEVRRIRISRRALQGGVSALLVFGIFFVLQSIFSGLMWVRSEDRDALRAENSELRSKIVALDQRLEGSTMVIQQLQQFDMKLRRLTMISDSDRNLGIGPVGGDHGEVLDPRERSKVSLQRDLMGTEVGRSTKLVEARTENMLADAHELHDKVKELSTYLEGQEALLARTPSRRPVYGGYQSSEFGMRTDPFTGLPTMHTGLDFSAETGTKVVSTADGLVIFAGMLGAYGNTVKVEHSHGLVSQFSHLSAMSVKVGESVKRGELLGEVGNTGRSTGPHLHYEVHLQGIPQDPQRFLLE